MQDVNIYAAINNIQLMSILFFSSENIILIKKKKKKVLTKKY